MTHYLYGSSIQGIQGFIFETNKLKEIAGASEIVEQLSFNEFEEFLGDNKEKVSYIQHAAGNIKLTADAEVIKRIVKYWPKYVEDFAPGLTLSQAVVELNEELTKDDIDLLEKKLKTARNKATMPAELAPMAVIRSRRTGKPAVEGKKDGPEDRANLKKDDNNSTILMDKMLPVEVKKKKTQFPFDISNMLHSGQDTGWLAVIHADGNSLGKILQDIPTDRFKEFSDLLNKSTEDAAEKATTLSIFKEGVPEKGHFPFRPVVIGGDDVTVIMRADLAIDFTRELLSQFETETKNNLEDILQNSQYKKLTACAGIAFMKSSYPFHYGIHLAEELCGIAKKASKAINDTNVPASLMFHKIQDSFVDSFKEIEERELTPQDDVSFKCGPYFLEAQENHRTIEQIQKDVQTVLEKDAPKSGIRKWLGYMHEDRNEADMWLKRVRNVTDKKYLDLLKPELPVHLYDVMSLASISKEKKEGK